MDFKDFKGAYALSDLVNYQADSVMTTTIMKNDKMIYVVKALDADTQLPQHEAPGDAIFTLLDGQATIVTNDTQYDLHAGQSITFVKGQLHSVYARTPMKMALVVNLG